MITLTVSGMTCTSCARHIEEGLARVRGVREARVSYPEARALIEAAPEVTEAALIAAIQALGYDAAPAGGEGGEAVGKAGACSGEGRGEGLCAVPATAAAPAPVRPRWGGGLRLAIIGSGGAATAAALRAAEAGAEVSVIERGTIGGTCVNVGCVPSKILIAAARIAHIRRESPFDAALPPAPPPSVRAGALRARISGRVTELRRSKYEDLLVTTPGIRLLRGTARFLDAHRLHVSLAEGGETEVPFDRALIATGATPALPAIPGLAGVPFWTSTEALEEAAPPPSLAILGGGNVAVELAQAFARLGSRVHLITRRGLLPREEPAIGEALAAIFREEGITLHLHARPQRVAQGGEGVRVMLEGGGEVSAARLLVATGRKPATAGLGLEALGVERTEDGAIRVDSRLRTSVPGIFAAGDCTTLPHYVYVAAQAGSIAAANMLAPGGEAAALDLSVLPRVVFTDPEVAAVGLEEAAARAAGLAVEVRTLSLEAVPRALARFDTRGFVKLVAEAKSGRLLGVQAVAAEAGEFITTAALALRAGLDVGTLGGMLFPYLTMAEGLKLAAQSFVRDVSRLSCCAA